MKKNFLMVGALMVTAFFAATEIAKAADVTFSGQIRTRYEINEQGTNTSNNFDNASDAGDFTATRVKLNANVNVNDSTSAFIQLQSARTWGGANGSFTASDADASVGLHQAYFTLKNFATLPVDLKLGRQEVVLDGHRLFGNTGWTTGAQTHDALRLDHKHDNMSFAYAWIIATEDGTPGNTSSGVSLDNEIEAHLAYFQYAGILGGKFSVTYAWLQDPCGTTTVTGCTTSSSENDIHTIGFRQAGQLYGIDYRAEYYYQGGDADQDGSTAGITGGAAVGTDVDRDAFMFGVRIGKTFNNVTMKPSLTLWYDYLSGTEDTDLSQANPEYKSFNTLFDTGHKFYGFQDLYLGVGSGSATNGTAGLGLQDIAIKTKLSPMPGWTLKADYHWFSTTESVSSNVARAVNTSASGDNELGNELDITLINKYNANTNISFGFSNYTTTVSFRDLRNVVGDGANWAYVMFDVKF